MLKYIFIITTYFFVSSVFANNDNIVCQQSYHGRGFAYAMFAPSYDGAKGQCSYGINNEDNYSVNAENVENQSNWQPFSQHQPIFYCGDSPDNCAFTTN